MRVFLTGGTGFIGQPLTKRLVDEGWEVVALVRNPQGTQARILQQMGARCVAGDVTDRESMRAAMMGADMVIHNAGHYEYGMDAEAKARMKAINVDGTRHVLDLALELAVPRSIYVSSVQAFGDSGPEERDETFKRVVPCRTTYEQSKSDAHQIALDYQARGLPLMLACPNGVIGPNDHSVLGYSLRLYLHNLLPPIAWAPDTMFSFVEVNDLAKGLALLAKKGQPGETYIFSGEARSIKEHLGYWPSKLGRFKGRLWLPAALTALAFWPLEPLQRAVGIPAVMSREAVMAASTHFNYSSGKAKRELGWSHQSAQEMWFSTIDGELALLQARQKRDILSLIKPLEEAISPH